MAGDFKTSFIPKRAVQETKGTKSSMGFLTIIGVVIFFLSLTAAGGMFLYQKLIERNIDRKAAELERNKSAFEPSLIMELSRLDRRIKLAEEILAGHTAPSAIFAMLEESTLRNVRFKNFNFLMQAGVPSISMTGEAVSFETVALQSDELVGTQAVLGQIFSALDVDPNGNVTFSYDAQVDTPFVTYKPRETTSALPDMFDGDLIIEDEIFDELDEFDDLEGIEEELGGFEEELEGI